MDTSWHYIKNGVQTGPATADEIKDMLTSGAMLADVLVWHEGMPNWLPASSQSEFVGIPSTSTLPTSTPPPVPRLQPE